jgi:hypothetical protein
MSSLREFRSCLPKRDKPCSPYPDFAGSLRIGEGLYNCGVWQNYCKDGRPYLALRLTKQGFGSKDTIKVALWKKPEAGHFERRLETASERTLIFRARINEDSGCLVLEIEPARCFDTEKLHQAIAHLPIPVLWQLLGLPGVVRPACCVRSPLRNDDRVPSFSIYAHGQRFKDHGNGVGGDAFDFFELITKLDSKTAYERFLELAAIPLKT